MFIDLGNATTGEWFTFRMSEIDENTGDIIWSDPIDGLEVQIRSWKPFFDNKVKDRVRETIWKVHPKTHVYEPHTQFKEMTVDEIRNERDEAIDYAIVGLKGGKDKNTKEEYPCTKEVKLGLMKFDFFDRFFSDCQKKIDSTKIILKEELEKN